MIDVDPRGKGMHEAALPRYEALQRLRAMGYSYTRIAALWGVTVQAVQQTSRRARRYGFNMDCNGTPS